MSNYIHGTNHSKWWILRVKPGHWLINTPVDIPNFSSHKFPSGAAALEAFANGK